MTYSKNLFYFIFILSAFMHSHFSFAQNDHQTIICDMWGDMSDNYFENFEILKQSGENDPIAWIKDLANYDQYHMKSAGGLMLRTIISGIEGNKSKLDIRNKVISQCNIFPADSVDSSNETEPLSDFK